MKRVKYLLLILLGIGTLSSCELLSGLFDEDQNELVGSWQVINYEFYVDDDCVDIVMPNTNSGFVTFNENGGVLKTVGPTEIWHPSTVITFIDNDTLEISGKEYQYEFSETGLIFINGLKDNDELSFYTFFLNYDTLCAVIYFEDFDAYVDAEGKYTEGEDNEYAAVANFHKLVQN